MDTTLKHPSAWIPIAMSLAALSIALGYVAMFGVAHHVDEGTAAHLFQFLIVAQVPIIAWFAITWLPRAPKQALVVLTLQCVAILTALAPVFYFEM